MRRVSPDGGIVRGFGGGTVGFLPSVTRCHRSTTACSREASLAGSFRLGDPPRVTPTTGRHVLLFKPGTWDRVEVPHHCVDAVFDSTGHAIVERTPKTILAKLRATRGIRVRPEVVLARPSTRVSSAPRDGALVDDATRSWALQALEVPPDARDGAGITVGLIDSGVDIFHPHLAGSIALGTPDGGRDVSGHGTHCAGVIVGRRPDRGVRYGIAPSALVRSYRVFDASGHAAEGRVRQAIHLAVEDGCRVLVLAAGVPAASFFPEDAQLGTWLAERGCLLFAAAGNESNRLFGVVEPTLAPANAPDVRAIGAFTSGHVLWNSSNGKGTADATRVDAVAPGVDVLGAWPGGSTIHMSGTSVATAIAGGVAAALWSRDKTMRASDVDDRMRAMAMRIRGPEDGLGDGALVVGATSDEPRVSRTPIPIPIPRRPAAMSDSNIDDVLEGVARLLDRRPDLRARVVVVELSRDGSNGALDVVDDSQGDRILGTEFNLQGHAVIALMAEQYLEKHEAKTHQKLQKLKGNDPLARGDIGSFAMWPDWLKHPPSGKTAEFAAQKKRLGSDRGEWHFMNIAYDPKHPKAKVDVSKANGELLKQLPGQIDLLDNSDKLTAADALCYVLHLMGDIHQPLHCAALADNQYFKNPPAWDKGGNLIRWGKDSKQSSENLHALWDDFIAEKPSEIEPRVTELLAHHPRSAFTSAQLKATLSKIAVESFTMAKKAYDDFLDEATYLGESKLAKPAQQFSSPSPQYRSDNKAAIRKRAALAAYRLADILKSKLG